MAKAKPPQSIPAALLAGYRRALRVLDVFGSVYPRPPEILKIMKTDGGHPSPAQLAVRAKFIECVECFNRQPKNGGVEWGGIGPYNRGDWYDAAIAEGEWYFNYFMTLSLQYDWSASTPDWCKLPFLNIVRVSTDRPNMNFFASGDAFVGVTPLDTNRAWLMPTDLDLAVLRARLTTIPWVPPPPPTTIIRAHAQSRDWIPWEITWNNQPALGEVIAETTLGDICDGYVNILIGTGHEAICLEAEGQGNLPWSFADDYPDEEPASAWRPYLI